MPTTMHLRGGSLRALLSTTSARRVVRREGMTAAINDPPSSRAADESRPSTDPGADALADTLADEVLSTGAGDGTKQFVHMGFGRVNAPNHDIYEPTKAFGRNERDRVQQ